MGAKDLARFLLVSEVTIAQILRSEGIASDDILDSEGVELLLMYYPYLKSEPLPEQGYTSVTDLISLLERTGIRDVRRLRHLAIPHGIEFRRFVAPGMPPDFYVTDDEANFLLEALGRPAT